MSDSVNHCDDARKQAALKKLEDLARQINPALPKDLSGRVVTICMSKDGVWASAAPATEGDIAQ